MSEDKTQAETENEESGTARSGAAKGIPSHLRADFGRSEAAQALKPGFRNPGNKNSKAQRKKKKGRKK